MLFKKLIVKEFLVEGIHCNKCKANVEAANSIGIKGIVYKQENILADVKNVVQANGIAVVNDNQR